MGLIKVLKKANNNYKLYSLWGAHSKLRLAPLVFALDSTLLHFPGLNTVLPQILWRPNNKE
jgi:hypothetical protein